LVGRAGRERRGLVRGSRESVGDGEGSSACVKRRRGASFVVGTAPMWKRSLFAASVSIVCSCGGERTAAPVGGRPQAPFPTPAPAPAQIGRITFRVGYDAGSDARPVEGRVLVAMTSLSDVANPFEVGFMRLRDEWAASAEIGPLAPGGSVDIDPD